MNPNYYDYHINKNFLEYLFCSEGPKGSIKKLVRFTQVNEAGITYYNLGFGNWNESTGTIDDVSVSNNQDTERILFTIATIILDFTDHYPDAIIYIKGSTEARTRLYQIKINRHWPAINDSFELYEYQENEGFTPFMPYKNYSAFAVRRKND